MIKHDLRNADSMPLLHTPVPCMHRSPPDIRNAKSPYVDRSHASFYVEHVNQNRKWLIWETADLDYPLHWLSHLFSLSPSLLLYLSQSFFIFGIWLVPSKPMIILCQLRWLTDNIESVSLSEDRIWLLLFAQMRKLDTGDIHWWW
jgi:hypothetical protein